MSQTPLPSCKPPHSAPSITKNDDFIDPVIDFFIQVATAYILWFPNAKEKRFYWMSRLAPGVRQECFLLPRILFLRTSNAVGLWVNGAHSFFVLIHVYSDYTN